MNNQNRILRQRQFEDTGDDVISFHEDEEEHNYLGKKELMEIEGDKSIDPDFSYDDDKSKLSTIKKNMHIVSEKIFFRLRYGMNLKAFLMAIKEVRQKNCHFYSENTWIL